VNKQVQMSAKEKKQEIKRLHKQLRDMKKKGSSEDAILDLELKIQEMEMAP
jgi:uncharacterized protein YlxW (UPF0749 family)